MTIPNAAQIHLALTHVPVVLSLTALVMLVISMLHQNSSLKSTAYWTFVIAGIFCIPVFLTGEGAEEIVEHLPGVSEHNIEEHEEIAKLALISCSISGILAIAGLIQREKTSKWLNNLILLAAIITSVLMLQTAHRGGSVRHTELQGNIDSISNERTEMRQNVENEED